MKPKAPEKIYLQVCGDCNDNDCENCKFEDLEDNVTWCKDKIFEKDIEYIRTDTFIEKTVDWLKENKDKYLYNTGERDEYIPVCSGKIIDEFRAYWKENKV